MVRAERPTERRVAFGVIRFRGAMTLVELVIAVFLLGLALLVTAEGAGHVRDQLKAARTWETLARLDAALTAYHAATGGWPEREMGAEELAGTMGGGLLPLPVRPFRDVAAGTAGAEAGRYNQRTIPRAETALQGGGEGAGERAARQVVAALRGVAASRAIVEGIRSDLKEPGSDTIIRDAWGRALRCLTAGSESAADRRAVAANGGRPVFVSLGADAERDGGGGPVLGLRSDELPG